MRYVSSAKRAETVAERIEDVRKRTPPPPERRARNRYISKDDFAELIGVSRARVYAWTRAENPEYPEGRLRDRLAELSGGRYKAPDFAKPGRAEGSLARRIAALEEQMGRLERHIFGSGASRAR